MLMALVAPGRGLPAALGQAAAQPPGGRQPAALPAGVPIDLMSRDELVAFVRAHEGEALEQAPFLLKATVALGAAMLAAAGLLLLGLGA